MNGQLKEIQDHLATLSAEMTAMLAKVNGGERVDLTDLHRRIGEISMEVVNARPQSASFLPSLKQLVAQLDEMALALKQQNEKRH